MQNKYRTFKIGTMYTKNAEKILKEITGSWSDKTTFHGKAIKKGGKKRD